LYNSRMPSNTNLDLVVSHLREQVTRLHKTVESIERQSNCQEEHISQSIKSVESELRRLRKLIDL